MIIHPNETLLKQVLYLEDVPIYCKNLNEHLIQNPVSGRQYNIVPAYCLEQGYAYLKNNPVDGIIVDLHIHRCNRKQLTDCHEQPVDLRNHAPLYPGLGLLLLMQQSHEWIADIPKLVLTGLPFESYAAYYDRLKGPKDYYEKEDFDGVNKAIVKWFKNFEI